MACSQCGQTGHKRPTCPAGRDEVAEELATLATMPNVRVYDKLPPLQPHPVAQGVTEAQLRRIFRGRGCE